MSNLASHIDKLKTELDRIERHLIELEQLYQTATDSDILVDLSKYIKSGRIRKASLLKALAKYKN